MNESNTYRSIGDVIDGTFGKDSDAAKRAKHAIEERKLSQFISIMRNLKGISQEEIANKLGVTEDDIEQFECASHSEITFEKLVEFTKACGLDLQIRISTKEKPPITEMINIHANALSKLLEQLYEMCKGDEAMLRGADAVKRKISGQIFKVGDDDMEFKCAILDHIRRVDEIKMGLLEIKKKVDEVVSLLPPSSDRKESNLDKGLKFGDKIEEEDFAVVQSDDRRSFEP